MKSKSGLSAIIPIFLLLSSLAVQAQNNGSVDVRKFELAADFSTNTFRAGQTSVGLGGRLTYTSIRMSRSRRQVTSSRSSWQVWGLDFS